MKIRIMIADDNENFRKIVHGALAMYPEFEIAAHAANGLEVLEVLHHQEIDVLILDIIMPVLDGIGVLERMKNDSTIKKRPLIFVVSSIANERVTKEIMDLGANFYFIKPFDMNSLANRIRDFMAEEEEFPDSGTPLQREKTVRENTLEREVTKIIQEIGVSPHLLGYRYLRSAILLVIQDDTLLSAVTTRLYPMIAKEYGTEANRVERAMRHAIESAWNRGRVDTINKFFGYTVSDYRGKPTNSEFIAMIADWIRLRMD